MPLRSLVTKLQETALTGELDERSSRPERLLMRGAGRCSRALVASALSQRRGAPLLVVVPTLEEAGRWTALLELMGWSLASLYPTSEGSPYEPFDPTSEITWGQLQVLSDLLGEPNAASWAIVATERCLQPHQPAHAFRCSTVQKLLCALSTEQLLKSVGHRLPELVRNQRPKPCWCESKRIDGIQ